MPSLTHTLLVPSRGEHGIEVAVSIDITQTDLDSQPRPRRVKARCRRSHPLPSLRHSRCGTAAMIVRQHHIDIAIPINVARVHTLSWVVRLNPVQTKPRAPSADAALLDGQPVRRRWRRAHPVLHHR